MLFARALLLCTMLLALRAGAQSGTFAVFKGADRVGSVSVQRNTHGEHTRYAMVSLSRVMLLWAHEIRTVCVADYHSGLLTACCSSVHVNNTMRDSSDMRTHAGKAVGYVHPRGVVDATCTNTWTTARMYYEEPVGQLLIYVESALRDCPLVRTGNGLYKLTLPNGHVNRYIYRTGVLQEIHVDRKFFDLVFKRV